MGGGAWPFLVGGAICLVNSVNERDLNLLNSDRNIAIKASFRLGFGEASRLFQDLVWSLLVLLLVLLLRGTTRV